MPGEKNVGRSVVDRWIVFKKRFVNRRSEPGDTYRFIWQKSQDVKVSYIIYRVVHAFLMLAIVLFSFFFVAVNCPMTTYNKDRYHCLGPYAQVNPAWPFYLTRWGLVLNFIQSVMGLIFASKAYSNRSKNIQSYVDNPVNSNKTKFAETDAKQRKTYRIAAVWRFLGASNRATNRNQSPPSASKGTTQSDETSLESFGNKQEADPKPLKNDNATDSTPKIVQEPNISHPKRSETSFMMRTYWGLHSVSLTLTIMIDLIYWIILHDYSKKETWIYFNYVEEHGINLLVMSVDSFVVAFPMEVSHIIHMTVFCSFYLVTTCIYYHAGGLDMKYTNRYLYRFLDWTKPWKTCLNVAGITALGTSLMFLLILVDIGKHRCFRPRRRVDAV